MALPSEVHTAVEQLTSRYGRPSMWLLPTYSERAFWAAQPTNSRPCLWRQPCDGIAFIKDSNKFYSEAHEGASRQRRVREGQNYTEACQLLIFSTGLIYVTLVGTEAATFGSPVQRANHCANETHVFIIAPYK